MDFHHLSRTAVVFKIIYLFQLFEFYCLLEQCFFGNSLFSLFFFEVFEREVRLLQKILRGIALPLTDEATILSGTLLKFTLR